ncbi:hypothetical protein AT6N2_C1827 [Agrobacterium tumefaciens]|nr:hypothetical protein AT6N2_C1827 [Agrobacterium tumefaciens]
MILMAALGMGAADAAHDPPDAQHREGNGDTGDDGGIDRQHVMADRLGKIADEPDDIIGDRGDGQTFHRLLQAKLHGGALVHGIEQHGVLPFQFHIDPASNQSRGAIELARQVGLSFFHRLAGAHGRCHAPFQKAAHSLMALNGRFRERPNAFAHDAVIGATGAETIEAERGIGLQLGGKPGHFGQQRIGLVAGVALHALGDAGQAIFDTADFRRQRLRHRQSEHGERAIGLDVEQALHQRAAAVIAEASVDHQYLRQPVAILAEIGEDRRLTVAHVAMTEAGGLEDCFRLRGRTILRANFQPHARDQRTGRRKAVAERIAGNLAAELFRRWTVPEPGREFGMSLPAQCPLPPRHGVVTRIAFRRGNTAAARHLRDDRMVHGRAAIHHEGKLNDDARRGKQHRRPRMHLAQCQRPFRRACECESTLCHCDTVPAFMADV